MWSRRRAMLALLLFANAFRVAKAQGGHSATTGICLTGQSEGGVNGQGVYGNWNGYTVTWQGCETCPPGTYLPHGINEQKCGSSGWSTSQNCLLMSQDNLVSHYTEANRAFPLCAACTTAGTYPVTAGCGPSKYCTTCTLLTCAHGLQMTAVTSTQWRAQGSTPWTWNKYSCKPPGSPTPPPTPPGVPYCNPGYRASGQQCVQCAVGKHNPDLRQSTTCDDCGVGKYADVAGLAQCKNPPGGGVVTTDASSGLRVGFECPPGTQGDGCGRCPAGYEFPAGAAKSVATRGYRGYCSTWAGHTIQIGSQTGIPVGSPYYQSNTWPGRCHELCMSSYTTQGLTGFKISTTNGACRCIITDDPMTCTRVGASEEWDTYFVSGGCTKCAKGKYTGSVGTATCAACTGDTYADATGQSQCKTVPDNSVVKTDGSGLRVGFTCAVNFAPTRDNTACDTAYSCGIGGVTGGGADCVCPTGSYQYNPTYNGATRYTCIFCPIGGPNPPIAHYTMKFNGCSCRYAKLLALHVDTYAANGKCDTTGCPAGSGTLKSLGVGSPTDNNCALSSGPCMIGTYKTGSFCTVCPVGKYAGATGSTTCTSCLAGKYAGAIASSACTTCSPGRYASSAGSSTCAICGANAYTNYSNPIACICNPGFTKYPRFVVPGVACFPITNCDLGTYMSAPGVCTRCQKGKALSNASHFECTACAPQTYSDDFGAVTCRSVPDNATVVVTGGLNVDFQCRVGMVKWFDGCVVDGRYLSDGHHGQIRPIGCDVEGSNREVTVSGDKFVCRCKEGYGSVWSALPLASGSDVTLQYQQYTNASYTATGELWSCRRVCPAGQTMVPSLLGHVIASNLNWTILGTENALWEMILSLPLSPPPSGTASPPLPPPAPPLPVPNLPLHRCGPGGATSANEPCVCPAASSPYRVSHNGVTWHTCVVCPIGGPNPPYFNNEFVGCWCAQAKPAAESYAFRGQCDTTGCPLGSNAVKTLGIGLSTDNNCALAPGPCMAGTYKTGATCTACPVGKHQHLVDQSTCIDCPPGSYQENRGQPSCTLCPNGWGTAGWGSSATSECKPCVAYNKIEQGTPPIGWLADGQVATTVSKADEAQPWYSRVADTDCAACPANTEYDSATMSCKWTQIDICPAGALMPCARTARCDVPSLPPLVQGQRTTAPVKCERADSAVVPSEKCLDTEKLHALACKSAIRLRLHNGLCEECPAGRAVFPGGFVTECVKVCADINKIRVLGQVDCTACPAGFIPGPSGATCVCAPGYRCGAIGYEWNRNKGISEICPVGTYAPGGREVRDYWWNPGNPAGACLACPNGRYQDQVGQAECKPCLGGMKCTPTGQSACLPGSYSPFEGASACQICERGKYQDEPGLTLCYACPRGRATEATGGTSIAFCESCKSGWSQSVHGEACTKCPAGRTTHGESAVFGNCSEVTCPVGTVYGGGSSEIAPCAQCPVDTFQSQVLTIATGLLANQSMCVPCAAGRSTYGIVAQQRCGCPLGAYIGPNSTCVVCPQGHFCDDHYNDYPVPCPRGTASMSTGKTTPCDVCPPGAEAATTGQSVCDPCVPGRYAPYSGTESCPQCPATTFTSASGGIGCERCPPALVPPNGSRTYCRTVAEVVAELPSGYCFDITTANLFTGECVAGTSTPTAGVVVAVVWFVLLVKLW